MSILDEFCAIFSDLPEQERLGAALDALLTGIKEGVMIAVPDGEGSCTYKHKKHCTPDEMESRLTIGEVKRQHEQLNRENMRYNN